MLSYQSHLDKMYRVVLWIKPKKGLANNGSVNPMKYMIVNKVLRFHEHTLPPSSFCFLCFWCWNNTRRIRWWRSDSKEALIDIIIINPSKQRTSNQKNSILKSNKKEQLFEILLNISKFNHMVLGSFKVWGLGVTPTPWFDKLIQLQIWIAKLFCIKVIIIWASVDKLWLDLEMFESGTE